MKVGQRIKQRRKELKMNGEELARRIGKNRATLYRYENGEIENLPLDILEPIAKALQTTPQYLMGWEKVEKKADTISDAVLRMKSDSDFMYLVDKLCKLDADQVKSVTNLLSAFLK